MVSEFWKNKKVFITGHTGFKGGWLVETLKMLGADIKGYALKPNTDPSFFESCNVANGILSEFGDIRDSSKLEDSISEFHPDIVFHLAAQPLVRYSYEHPKETYEVNVIGTLNVLEAIKKFSNIKAAVLVTTDKCYENKEWDYGYREIDPMGGHDPYSSSKGCCELLISSYRNSFFYDSSKKIASARAGNVIGGGDWSQDRLVPDILRAIYNNEPPIIRNSLAIRPWQHVLEPVFGYIILAEKLYSNEKGFDEAWNFGPNDKDCRSVGWITSELLKIAKTEFSWVEEKNYNLHEAQLLKLDISKAVNKLGWYPKWNINIALNQVIDWHNEFNFKRNTTDITKKQITEYIRS
jgi:CDP-glucose 4,6-dehydratase